MYNIFMYVSIDIGGSKTRVGSSSDCVRLDKVKKIETVQSFDLLVKDLSDLIYEVTNNDFPDAICIGIPGVISEDKSLIKKAHNIPFLDDKLIVELLPYFANSEILAYNDMALSAMTESNIGAGHAFKNVAYITLSTGVGGMLVQNKKLNENQSLSEPGHMIISLEGKDLESFISGKSFERIYNKSPMDCDDPKIWKEYSEYLYIGVINILAMWDPDVIVFGGGVSNKFDEFIKPNLLEKLQQQTFFKVPELLVSKFGDDSGLLGGLLILKQCLKIS